VALAGAVRTRGAAGGACPGGEEETEGGETEERDVERGAEGREAAGGWE
jgi:hypothetical protein